MRDERRRSDDDEVFPAGDEAPSSAEDSASSDEDTFPAGVESDEARRPGDELDDDPPGMLEDPPRAD